MDTEMLVGLGIALACVTGMLLSAMKAFKEKQKARRALSLLRAMFENSNIGKTETVPGGKIIRANRAFCEFTGYTAEELEEISWRDITHPDDHVEAANAVNAMVHSMRSGGDKDAVTFFARYKAKSGKYAPAFVNVTYVSDDCCDGILLAEIQRTDEFLEKHRQRVAKSGLDFVTQPIT